MGILVLHGWTAGIATVSHLCDSLELLNLPVSMPILSGHDPSALQDLEQVHWEDWVEDAEYALVVLLTTVERVVIIGHSMGGMLAYYLAATHPEGIDSIVSAGTPGKLRTPFAPGNFLHPLFCLLWPLVKTYDKGTLDYADPALALLDDSPRRVPTSAIKELFDFLEIQKDILPGVHVPVLILQSTRDASADPVSAWLLYNQISTPVAEKHIAWFDKSGHSMFLDVEKEQVIQKVIDYIKERMR